MPLALDPSQTFEVILDSDKDKKPPPAFRFRYSSGRQWMQIAKISDAVQESASGSEALEKMYDVLRVPLVGWTNMTTAASEVAAEFGVTLPAENLRMVELPYKPELLDVLLGPGEAKELLEKVMSKIAPGADEKNV